MENISTGYEKGLIMPNGKSALETARELYERSMERLVQIIITLNAGAITFSASLIRGDVWWLLSLVILFGWILLLTSLINGVLFLFERSNAQLVNLAVLDRGFRSIDKVPDAKRHYQEFSSQAAKAFQRCLSTFIGGIILLAVFAVGRIFGGWFLPLIFLLPGLTTHYLVHRYLSNRSEEYTIDFAQK